MQATLSLSTTTEIDDDHEAFVAGMLTGYRFRVCQTAEDWAKALEVRRAVYHGGCGYEVPVPDDYDTRSWMFLAEDVETGKAVGTMRLTPRFAGTLEAEEYFKLPLPLRGPNVVEITRFAILPEYRKGKTFLPVVSLGLFKLVREFGRRAGIRHLVVSSKPERVWTYEWLWFRNTGLSTAYEKLAGAQHELLEFDIQRTLDKYDEHPFGRFLRDFQYDEIEVPSRIPSLGDPGTIDQPLRAAVGA